MCFGSKKSAPAPAPVAPPPPQPQVIPVVSKPAVTQDSPQNSNQSQAPTTSSTTGLAIPTG